MTLHVFLKNKIISADAILPVLLDARRLGLRKPIRFYLQSPAALEALKKNVVLWAALQELGQVELVVPADRRLWTIIVHRIWAAYWLLSLAVSLATGKGRIIHFGQLYNASVYRPFLRLRPRSVLLVEGAFAGFSPMQVKFARLKEDRAEGPDLSLAPVVAVFEEHSELADAVRARGKTPFVIGKPHALKGWTDFLEQEADAAFPDEHRDIIGFILGTFGELEFLRDKDTAKRLFSQTLTILAENGDGRPIYIKPHIITEMDLLKELIAAQPEAPIVISNLHPALIASRALFTIANYYSTALSTIKGMGGTTIEYTDYSDEALRLSNGQSMRADSITHFVNGDKDELRRIVASLSQQPNQTDRADASVTGTVPRELLHWLAA